MKLFNAYVLALVLTAMPMGPGFCANDLATLEQQAVNAAVSAVADSVVQINTVGGLDRLDQRVLAQGPTTGVIVSQDGYIVSSAFNFVQEPSSILVRLPSGEQLPAEMIGRDDNRMLVLLKVSAEDPLPTPTAAPAGDVRPGDWAVALGRTFSHERVSLSVGIVSALNRMHGRALQTDANVSASNYGGPLVDIQGRVLGILVPMAPPTGNGEESYLMAGSEFYDSGIGFAVPLSQVQDVLERWKNERDLHRGLLGVGLKAGNAYSTPAEITAVWPRSAASQAGLKAKDRIVSVDGHPIKSQNDLRFRVTPRYAGDELELTIRRGRGADAKEITTTVELSAKLPVFKHAFLGILPERSLPAALAEEHKEAEHKEAEDKEARKQSSSEEPADAKDAGDESEAARLIIRGVWPESGADEAGIQDGDRLVSLGDETVTSWAEALEKLDSHSPGEKLSVEINRDDEKQELLVTLEELPTKILPSSFTELKEKTEPKDNASGARELEELKLPEMSQAARYITPSGDGPAPGLLLWLGDAGKEAAEALARQWSDACERDRLIVLIPEPADKAGWSADDQEYLARLLQTAIGRFGVDRRRIVVAGRGKAGQLAYAMAFAFRKEVDGVIVVDSPLPRTLELPDNGPNQRLAVLSIETANTPLGQLLRDDRQQLIEKGYPATQISVDREGADKARLDDEAQAKAARWIDGLDRF